MRTRAKRLQDIASRVITVAAFIFIAFAIRREWDAISARPLPSIVWPAIAGLAATYGVSLILVAEVWHRLVSDFARSRLPRTLTLPSYALSQLAKYVPGNIFQYLGRHGRMSRGGVANVPLLKAVVWDIACLLIAAAIAIVIGLLVYPPLVTHLPANFFRNAALATLVTIGGVAAALAISPRLASLAGKIRPRAATVVAVIPLLLLFFFIQAGVFVVLAAAIGGTFVPQLASVAVMSWLAGILPLGTPAGIGTREAMVVLLAGPLIGAADALLLAALFRLTTTLGDCICYLIGLSIASRIAAPA